MGCYNADNLCAAFCLNSLNLRLWLQNSFTANPPNTNPANAVAITVLNMTTFNVRLMSLLRASDTPTEMAMVKKVLANPVNTERIPDAK